MFGTEEYGIGEWQDFTRANKGSPEHRLLLPGGGCVRLFRPQICGRPVEPGWGVASDVGGFGFRSTGHEHLEAAKAAGISLVLEHLRREVVKPSPFVKEPSHPTLQAVEYRLENWHDTKYGPTVKVSETFEKLIDEQGELARAMALVRKGAGNAEVLEELADVAIVCFHLARAFGGRLGEWNLRKIVVNEKRLHDPNFGRKNRLWKVYTCPAHGDFNALVPAIDGAAPMRVNCQQCDTPSPMNIDPPRMTAPLTRPQFDAAVAAGEGNTEFPDAGVRPDEPRGGMGDLPGNHV
jgi:NTP pyrophosphatase (non-canonical NTP hydrolase)